jgi:hypothetical protein
MKLVIVDALNDCATEAKHLLVSSGHIKSIYIYIYIGFLAN